MMKKIMFLVTTGLSAFAFSQVGKVGVNTSTPTEVFHINGTTRIQDLPASGTSNAIYNGAATKTTAYTATRTVVSNDNGVLGYVDGIPAASSGSACSTYSTKSYTTNASSASQTIDLSGETNPACLYVINDQTNSSNGYTINVTLPANNAGTTGRVLRFISVPTTTNNGSGLKFNGNIGNLTLSPTNLNATTFTNGTSVSIGANNVARHETVITFYEINGKWYADRIIAKAN